jgi:alkanesulfonate monooxygenase SsuD/methylene tetrahydromethanopterin reductase-like flavin-dependent oxidoreductase (luciferase family)
MEIGMTLPVMSPGLDRDTFLKWCERVDSGPFATIAAGERVSFYNPDITAALAAAAVLTTRVKVMSGVFVPMLHHPVMLAKQLATIDVLSGGRFVAGLGVGGRDQDYQSVDAPLGKRLTRLAKSVEAMRSVWRGEPVVEGALPVGPAPVQKGGPKLLAGSIMVESIEAASKWADGLCGFSFGPARAEIDLHFRAARLSWKARGKPAPWLGTGFWYALGPGARGQLDAYLDRYLNFMAPVARESVKQICIATTPQALKDALQQAKDAGADDVVLVPTTSDPDDVHRVADILG